VVFAAIGDAVFGEQFRVNFVPPQLGIGDNAIQIEDHSAEHRIQDYETTRLRDYKTTDNQRTEDRGQRSDVISGKLKS
jgi:hypothetical protein